MLIPCLALATIVLKCNVGDKSSLIFTPKSSTLDWLVIGVPLINPPNLSHPNLNKQGGDSLPIQLYMITITSVLYFQPSTRQNQNNENFTRTFILALLMLLFTTNEYQNISYAMSVYNNTRRYTSQHYYMYNRISF